MESRTFGHICVQPRRKIEKKTRQKAQEAILIGAINYTRLTLTVSVLLWWHRLHISPSLSLSLYRSLRSISLLLRSSVVAAYQ